MVFLYTSAAGCSRASLSGSPAPATSLLPAPYVTGSLLPRPHLHTAPPPLPGCLPCGADTLRHSLDKTQYHHSKKVRQSNLCTWNDLRCLFAPSIFLAPLKTVCLFVCVFVCLCVCVCVCVCVCAHVCVFIWLSIGMAGLLELLLDEIM